MRPVSKTEEIWFLSAKRTPFGTFGGSLKELSPTELAVESAKAAIAQAKVAPEDIQHVVYGNVIHSSPRRLCRCRIVDLFNASAIAHEG